ncbi:MAG: DUF3971 domain-containing protein [Marinicella sp.]|nr:hypothetical protein [Xanthomonadales bacterium]
MTKTKKHHWLFKLWVKLRGLLALLIVLAGVCVGLLSLLLPFESLYQKQLEAFLEEQWGLVVEVDEVEGSWHGYGPYFSLKNLSLSGKQTITLEAASLSINVYQLLIPGGRTGIDLSINKAELDMIHSTDGPTITINDEQDEAKFTEMLDRVLASGSLRVNELLLNVANQQGDVLLEGLIADFLLEQDQDNRAFRLLIHNENRDQNIVVRSISARTKTLSKNARWHIAFNQFDLSQLKDLVKDVVLPEGKIDGEVWLEAKNGYVVSSVGLLKWQSVDNSWSFQLGINHQGDDKNWLSHWRIDRLRINDKTFANVDFWGQRQGDVSEFRIDTIPLEFLARVQAEVKPQSPEKQALLDQLQGVINPVEMTYDYTRKQMTWAHAQFANLALQHNDIDVKGLAGEVDFYNQQVKLRIDSSVGYLAIPAIFRGVLNWQELTAQVDFSMQPGSQILQVNSFWCDCVDFNLALWLQMNLADTKSLILASKVTDVTVNKLWKYWPHNVWKPKTLDWLDNSLLAGYVEKGFVFVQGDLVPELFKTGAAAFISRAYVKETANRFRPDWPIVEAIDAVALFTQHSVHVSVEKAVTQGLRIAPSEVDIASLEEGIITVDMTAYAKNNQVLDYLNQSPLSENIKLSNKISLKGEQQIDLNFDIPLKSEEKQAFKPNGNIRFNNTTFSTDHLTLDDINGSVKLVGYQLMLKDLPAALDSTAVTLNGHIITKSAEGVQIDVDLDGVLDAGYLLNKINTELPIQGASTWHINIQDQQDELFMTAESDLTGVSIDLPAPLNKKTDEPQTLQIKCSIPCSQSEVALSYADKINSTIQSNKGQYELSQLNFLNPDEPKENSNPFGGDIDEVNLDEWLTLLPKKQESTQQKNQRQSLPFNDVSLHIERLIFMSRTFKDVALDIRRSTDSLVIQIESPAIKGLVEIADDLGRKGVVAQFEHLNWIDTNDAGEVVVTNHSSKVPDIHLWVDEFSYLGIPLGELRMEMRNVADGIIVELLSIKSEMAEINVSGEWHKSVGRLGQSNFNVVMFSERIADFLQTVGFNAPITNAQTLIKMNAVWDDVPSQFDMAKIDGELDIKLGQGQVLDQKPGFGRVLGLFNLTNLPRRLILDFRDVLAEGLLFRSMEGHFVINQGVASTDNFLIKASSARIHINGDVGFADQSYNQTITVRPQIGKTFPTIGAIAGGPVGAAAGFLVQGLFDKQLKNKNEIIYRVTGTWDEPQIDLITDE